MSRVLVAGIGNLFFGDDGFGSEVARQLLAASPSHANPETKVETKIDDFGIRALHLAYELLAPFDLCILADCMQRGGAPGTLYVVEPDVEVAIPAIADAHTMNLSTVAAALRGLGGTLPRTLVVGCEPAAIEPGIGLSPQVAGAIPAALDLIRDLITAQREDVP